MGRVRNQPASMTSAKTTIPTRAGIGESVLFKGAQVPAAWHEDCEARITNTPAKYHPAIPATMPTTKAFSTTLVYT